MGGVFIPQIWADLYLGNDKVILFIFTWQHNTFISKKVGMKTKKTNLIGDEKYNQRELSQLIRRKMIQKSHGDETLFNRKQKHKNQHDDYDWYPGNY